MLTKFAVAALVFANAYAAEAEAQNYGTSFGGYGQPSYGSSHGHGGYGGHGPHGGTTNHSHISHSQSVNGHSPGYGGTGYGHFGTPSNEGNGAYYANSPWGNTENATRAGWWSSYQQYSPPQIPYTPDSSIDCPIFAKCTIAAPILNAGGIGIDIDLAQLPHKPIAMRASIAATTFNPGEIYAFEIREWGTVGDATMCQTESQTGKVYNPLKEIDKYGRDNPYQDPNRGSINGITIPAGTINTVAYEFTQNQLLQNLQGKESILGRSIVFLQQQADGTFNIMGCCPIVQTQLPTTYRAYPNPYPYFHAQPSHHQGLPYYGAY